MNDDVEETEDDEEEGEEDIPVAPRKRHGTGVVKGTQTERTLQRSTPKKSRIGKAKVRTARTLKLSLQATIIQRQRRT